MTEAPRQDRQDDERDDQPVVTPLRPLPTLGGLQTLDLGIEDATGLVCAIDDPDCVAPTLAMTSSEDDA